MKILTFPGGIHPRYNKAVSLREPLRETALPDNLVIPLSQHIGSPNKPTVNKDDYVEEGQIIGRSDAFVSSPVHSPVFGTVKDIKQAFHPSLGMVDSVFIERDKERPSKQYNEREGVNLSPEEVISVVREAGIVGMGGAAFPTHVKLSVPEGKTVDTLIINGAECEPYLTCDHLLMTKKTKEIISGIELLAGALNIRKIYIAIENNKKAAFFAFQKIIATTRKETVKAMEMILLEVKYPQGGEKQLIKAVTGKEVPPGKLPMDVGCLVHNVGTVFAVYEAVYCQKPLIERIVTISGDCLEKPGNYKLRIGTILTDIIEKFDLGISSAPRKIIFGGPMMGFAQPAAEAQVLKSTSGILFLSDKAVKETKEDRCIKCAKCVDVCPMRLSPTDIMKNTKEKMWDEVDALRVADCMECGSCSYICPGRIPLVQYIKEGKAALRKRG